VKKHNGNRRRGPKSGARKPAVVGLTALAAPKVSRPPAAQRRAAAHARPMRSVWPRVAVATRYQRDERLSLVLLLAPFLILAASLAGQQALRTASLPHQVPAPAIVAVVDPRSQAVPVPAPAQAPPATAPAETAVPPVTTTPAEAPPREIAALPPAGPAPSAVPPPAVPVEAIVPPIAPTPVPVAPAPQPKVLVKRALPPPPRPDLPAIAPPSAVPRVMPPDVVAAPPPAQPPVMEPAEHSRIASLDPALRPDPSRPLPPEARALPPPLLPPILIEPDTEGLAVCHAKPNLLARARALRQAVAPGPLDGPRFGLALAAAARAQLDDLVIYNNRYSRIRFPNGDVASLYGVCTDVIVRAYRALDIDLQQLVYVTRSGRGDFNIDHRRVEVLRRFFARHGEALPITDFAEDYQPGDIVTYYRPQNRTSTSHIAIVSDLIAPSGRPLIIHNRGWGPQLEDALFVDRITGHYRFAGIVPRAPAAQSATERTLRGRDAGKLASVRARAGARP
jgi:hypothetical protein